MSGLRGSNIRLPPPPSTVGGTSRERQVGVLKITCERAEKLPSKVDAFMRVRIGAEDRRTKSVSKSRDPRWFETIELKGRLQDFMRPLSVSVFDEARRKSGQPTLLGEVPQIDLKQVLTQINSKRFELDLPNRAGTVIFSVSWEGRGSLGSPAASPPSQTFIDRPGHCRTNSGGSAQGHRRTLSGGDARSLGLDRMPPLPARSPPDMSGIGHTRTPSNASSGSGRGKLLAGAKGGDSERRGQLYVRVHSAKGLRAADLNFRSDPYVIAQLGGSSAKTTVIKKTVNPTWEQTLDLGVHTLGALLSQHLVLKVYDEDKQRLREVFSSTDDLIGECAVRLDALEHDEKKSFAVALSKGTLSFTVTFKVLGKAHQLPVPEKLPPPSAGSKKISPASERAFPTCASPIKAAR